MGFNDDFKKRYFTDEVWARYTAFRDQRTLEQQEKIGKKWENLYQEAETLLGENPACKPAKNLALRWLDLAMKCAHSDQDILAGHSRAWADRGSWPAKARERLMKFSFEKLAPFIHQAIVEYHRELAIKRWLDSLPEWPSGQ
jgi:hypothetical protein